MTLLTVSLRVERGRRVSFNRARERQMHYAAGRRDGLDSVILLKCLLSVPEPYTAAEQDRDHHDVHVVDQSRRKELADQGGASADAYVLVVRGLAGRVECLGRRGIDKVEGR